MEIVVNVLMMFIVVGCAFKLSLWRWWQTVAYSVVVALFIWWSQRYAILQSKTQLADFLENSQSLQTMSILVTIESCVYFAFVFNYLRGDYFKESRRWWTHLLWWYPSLLVFPVSFYILTQTIFIATGIDFNTTSIVVALSIGVILPLLAKGFRLLLPDDEARIEMLLLSGCVICVLGLLSTACNRMLYHRNSYETIDLRLLGLVIVIFMICVVVGGLVNNIRWRKKKHSKHI